MAKLAFTWRFYKCLDTYQLVSEPGCYWLGKGYLWAVLCAVCSLSTQMAKLSAEKNVNLMGRKMCKTGANCPCMGASLPRLGAIRQNRTKIWFSDFQVNIHTICTTCVAKKRVWLIVLINLDHISFLDFISFNMEHHKKNYNQNGWDNYVTCKTISVWHAYPAMHYQ